MTETQYPDNAGEMAALIDARADPDHAYQRAVDAARAEHQQALATLETAKADLRQHEINPPDDDPAGWAARKRELTDLIPVLETMARQRQAWLQTAMQNQRRVRRSVAQEIELPLHRAVQRAGAELEAEKRRLQSEIERLNRGDYLPLRQASKRNSALRQALHSMAIYE